MKAKIAIVAVLATLSFGAQANDVCKQLGNLGSEVMKIRVNGVSKATVLERLAAGGQSNPIINEVVESVYVWKGYGNVRDPASTFGKFVENSCYFNVGRGKSVVADLR